MNWGKKIKVCEEQRPDQMRCYQRRSKNTCSNTFLWKRGHREELTQQEEGKGVKSSLHTYTKKKKRARRWIQAEWCMHMQAEPHSVWRRPQHPPYGVLDAEHTLGKCVHWMETENGSSHAFRTRKSHKDIWEGR